MRKQIICLALSVITVLHVTAQVETDKKTLTGPEAQAMFSRVGIDSARFLRTAATDACACIDSLGSLEPDKKKKIDGFAGCIDRATSGYQLAVKLLASMAGGSKEITISTSKTSAEYQRYYYDIERWVNDSCKAFKTAIKSNSEEKEQSISKDQVALQAYDKGVRLLRTEKYEDAIPFFESAVSKDDKFGFAWDNLAVCYRQTGKYEKAEKAYKISLQLDPQGKTALQNLPVVYMLEKKPDDAIAAYQEILRYYPDDPEVYYGIGIVYFTNLKNMEKALDYVCNAYNIYVKEKSPYRSDAEKVINKIYVEMKKDNKEDVFKKILKDNNITPNM